MNGCNQGFAVCFDLFFTDMEEIYYYYNVSQSCRPTVWKQHKMNLFELDSSVQNGPNVKGLNTKNLLGGTFQI